MLFIVSEDWFFLSHLIERAQAAIAVGYQVSVAANFAPDGNAQRKIEAAGIESIPINLARGSLNPFREVTTILEIYRLLRSRDFSLVHQVALKPVLYGSLAARLLGEVALVNAPVGMGFVFSSDRWLARILRPLIGLLLRLLLNPPGSIVIFENNDDRSLLIKEGAVTEQRSALIRGAGVDVEALKPVPPPAGVPIVALVARMLVDKGIWEFVKAAHLLKERGVACRFWLIGGPDPENRNSISERQLKVWQEEGIIEWLGHSTNVPELLIQTHIACLPSYREGLPKSLLEGMALGLPVVTTDVPGCRETVIENLNGLLVPPRDAEALADAIESLVLDEPRRNAMGRASRDLVCEAFSTTRVCRETLAVYRYLLARRGQQ